MLIEYSFDEKFKKLFKKLDRMDKSYKLRQLDGIGEQLDLNEFSRKFFSKKGQATADVSVDANANVEGYSVVHYNHEVVKPIQRLNAYYLLWKYGNQLFNEEIAEDLIIKQFTKEYYINDLHGMHGLPYCYNFSTMNLVCNGIDFAGQTKSKPATHLSAFIGHVIAFLTFSCNNVLGSVGLSDLLICSSYFVEKLWESKSDISKENLESIIKQELQSFIFSANQPFRSSIQTPFSNVSIFDDVFLTKLCNEYIFPDGRKVNKETVKYTQRLFLDLMNETLKETAITFPIVTACFSIDNNKIADEEFLSFIVDKNFDYGFMNIYAGATSTLSSCCRMRSDTNNEYFNTFGSGSTRIGSQSVCTLNLPRIAYTTNSEEEFFVKLEENVIAISRVNHIKRFIIKKRIDNNNAPLYNLGYMTLNTQYSTCGFNGLYECCEIVGKNILTVEGQEFATKILDTINEVNERQSKHFKCPINSEQTPSENSAIKLAEADKILGYNNEYVLYSNQFIPLVNEADIIDRIRLQGRFDSKCGGGSIAHLNFVDKITDKNYLKKMIRKAVESGVIYFAINYNHQECANHHFTIGKKESCPTCGAKIIANRTRVVGFLTNVNMWAEKRRNIEYPNRKWYKT